MNLGSLFESIVMSLSPDVIFIKLLNVSISACWLVVAVLLFRLIFRKAPKWLTVALWAVVAVRLICPVSFESSLSLVPVAEPLPVEILHMDPHKVAESTTVEFINNPVYSEYVNSSVPVDVESFQWDAVLGGLGWFYGMLAMVFYALFSYLHIYLKVKQSVNLKENIYLCDRISTPFIFGIVRPKIYLPSFMSEEDMTYVLAHERAHLKRRDYLWKPMGFAILTLYWFNPVIWLSYILLCRDIELACDEKVIKEMGEEMKKPYSMALINCSVPRRMITACPVAFGETGVKKRIKAVLSYKKPALWIIVIALIASVAVAVCFVTSPKSDEGTLTEKNYLIKTDEGEEMFRFDEMIEYSEYFMVYKGEKSYFKATPGAGRSTVLNFLSSLSLERLPGIALGDFSQSSKIEAVSSDGNTELIFCDGFSKLALRSTTGSTVTESSLYAVDKEKVKAFFDGEKYIKQGNIWECNFASSAYGHGFIVFYTDELLKLTEEPTVQGGRIDAYTSDEHGNGYMWTPEITEEGVGDKAAVTFKGIMYGKESEFTVNITKVGQNDSFATYYLISAEDTVVGNFGTNYEYCLSKPVAIGENNEWYCNPTLSHTGYSGLYFSLPTEYKIVSAECTKGTAEIKNRYYLEPEGEKQIVWSPDFDTYLTDKIYEITINALKKGENVSFTVKVIGQEKTDEIRGRMFTLEFVDCIGANKGWANYELHEKESGQTTDLDSAVSKAILELNSKSRWLGECPAEGHIIFGTKKKDSIVTVYMMERYSSYGFEDGWFIEQGGHSIPAVMRFELKDGKYSFLDVEYAEDGANHIKSIKRMFPKIYEGRVNNLTKKEQESLDSQCEAYAKAYLDSIGRQAPIGNYSDLNVVLLTDVGVSVDVSNKLLGIKTNFDTGKIGWFERIENDVRYIYRTSYAQEQNRIIYTKENYETKEIVEKIEVDSLTGNIIAAHNSPLYKEYFDAEVIEAKDGYVTVKPFENTDEAKAAQSITVALDTVDEMSLPTLYEGLYIRILYDGKIEKGSPAKINGASAIYLYADMNYIGNQAPAADSSQKNYTFDAKVIDVSKNGDWLIAEPFEGTAERKSSSKIHVSTVGTDLEGRTDIEKGTSVRIMYDGMIMESYPAQLGKVSAIYLISELPDNKGKQPTTKAYYITE